MIHDDIVDDINRTKELIRTYKRSLHALEIRRAKDLISTPPSVSIEIEDIETKIAELHEKLDAFEVTLLGSRRRFRVSVEIDGSRSNFTSDIQSKAIDDIATLLNIQPSQVRILGVFDGSIILKLDMPASAAVKFISAVEANPVLIQGFEVKQVTILPAWPRILAIGGLAGLIVGLVVYGLENLYQRRDFEFIFTIQWLAVIVLLVGLGLAVAWLVGRPNLLTGILTALLVAGPMLALPPAIQSTAAPTPTTTPTIAEKPTNTPRPTATPSPSTTPTPTDTPAPTDTPTQTPRPCRYATIEAVIDAEAVAVNTEDLSIIQEIFAPRATIIDRTNNRTYDNPVDRYQTMFGDTTFSDVVHPEKRRVELGASSARYTSSNSGSYLNAAGAKVPFAHGIDSDRWTLAKNASGCWVITEFSFE